MSEVKERPNFTISSRTPPEVDYEEFKKDFLDCFVSVDELKEKYGLTNSEFKVYRQRVLDDTGLKRKPTYSYRPIRFFGQANCGYRQNAEFIQEKNNGFIISKTTDGHTKYFGRYRDYETAQIVRDKLLESNWDENVGTYYKNKYGVLRGDRKPAFDKAKEIYPEFKELYLNSDLPIKQILKRLNATQRVYSYLIKMVREDMGDMNYRRTRR